MEDHTPPLVLLPPLGWRFEFLFIYLFFKVDFFHLNLFLFFFQVGENFLLTIATWVVKLQSNSSLSDTVVGLELVNEPGINVHGHIFVIFFSHFLFFIFIFFFF